MKKHLVFNFGRFNPPHIGHELLINTVNKIAKSKNADMAIIPSKSQDKEKNPLYFDEKINFLKSMFPKFKNNFWDNKKYSGPRVMWQILPAIYDMGYTSITLVVGEDRLNSFNSHIKYNGIKGRHGFFDFEEFDVVSAGQRDPDSDDVSGMSASKMRQAVKDDDIELFKKGIIRGFKNTEKLFNTLQKNMNENNLIEKALNCLNLNEAIGYKSISDLLKDNLNFKGKTLIFFDTETTGFDPFKDISLMTEIGAWVVDGDTMETIKEFNLKANLSQEIKDLLDNNVNSEIYKKYQARQKEKDAENAKRVAAGKSPTKPSLTLNDILQMTQYYSKTAEFTEEKDMIEKFLNIINKQKNPIMIAHNASFDMKYLSGRAKKFGLKVPKTKVIDTLKISQDYFIPFLEKLDSEELRPVMTALMKKKTKKGIQYSSRLGDLAKAFDIDITNWHNAFADVEMMVKVLAKILELLNENKNVDISDFQQQKMLTGRKNKIKKRQAIIKKARSRLSGVKESKINFKTLSGENEYDSDGQLCYNSKKRKKESKMDDEKEIDEVLSRAGRKAIAKAMKRNAKKIQKKKELALKKKAPPEKLKQRAEKKAREMIKAKLLKGKNPKDLGVSALEKIELAVSKKSAAIKKIAKKLLPDIKQKEAERIAALSNDDDGTNEDTE